MLTEKKVLIRVTIAQAANTITSPIIAAVICPLAASVWALSPPDEIHLIPPITSMKKKINAATTTTKVTAAETSPAKVTFERRLNCPLICKLIEFWAKRSGNIYIYKRIMSYSVYLCQERIYLAIHNLSNKLRNYKYEENYKVGIVNWRILILKKVLISWIMAQAANTITSPIKAAVICPLAASVWALSPPDEIHLIPPIISMKKKIRAATIRTRATAAEIIAAKVTVPRFEN